MGMKVRATGAVAVSTERAPDLDMVRRALAVLADPERGIQLHANHDPGWPFRAFRGDDLDGMLAWVSDNGAARGIYYTLNPCAADLAGEMKNGDALRRRHILVDIDRNKAENQKLSATDKEHASAGLVAALIGEYLAGHGWPGPIKIDSGNGFHLVYRVDMANDEDGRRLVRAFLRELADRFSGTGGDVGFECHDARRVSKLPGTWARRGPESPERPHRLCRLLDVPAFLETVETALIRDTLAALRRERAAAGKAPAAIEAPPLPGKDAQELAPPAPAATPSGLKVRAPAESDGYARAALERECGRMATTPSGQLNNQLFKSGAALGNLVGSGALAESEVFEALLRAARAAGCDSPQKDTDTIRRGLEAGKATPREAPERPEPIPGTQPVAPTEHKTSSTKPEIYGLRDLLRMELPAPRWAVAGLLSEGLGILAGKPKLGKSWMALNLALTVAQGGLALGSIRVLPGDVLYLSLEDRLRRVQDRVRKLLVGLQGEARLNVAVRWSRAHEGGMGDIREWAKSVDRPALVVIDVWAKFKRPASARGNAYEQDYAAGNEVKDLADSLGTTILLIHHCKKAAADDVMDEISGTLGFAGAADTMLVLTRARGENEATLTVTGRDVEDQEMALEFTPGTCAWRNLGSASERTESVLKSQLIELFRQNVGAVFNTTEITARLAVPDRQRDYLRNLLYRMANEELIEKAGPGKFRWRVHTPETQQW